jgi:hypothetical protein
VQPSDVAAIMDSPPVMRMGPQPPSAERDEAMKLIFQLSEADCTELLSRIRREKPEIWKRVCGAD